MTLTARKENGILCTGILIDYGTLENTKGKNTSHAEEHGLQEALVQSSLRPWSVWHLCRWWFSFIKNIIFDTYTRIYVTFK